MFLIGPFKFARERVNVQRVWYVSRFFPRNVKVNTPGRILIVAIPKQHLHDNQAEYLHSPNFNKYISYISKIDQEKDLNVKNKM